FLLRALKAYRRTLAIDSENVAAHYGLGLIYNELGRDGSADASDPRKGDPIYSLPDDWSKAIADVVAPQRDVNERVRSVRSLLNQGVEKVVTGPRNHDDSRLEPLYEVVDKVGPLTEADQPPALRAALARLLESTHKSLHQFLKPDETAEGRAV